MKVRYKGSTIGQIRWGGNDDPRDLLILNEIYTVKETEIHTWHTKYILEEHPSLKFNSVCFDIVEEEENEHFCPRCGFHYFTHNDDGSCVEDD